MCFIYNNEGEFGLGIFIQNANKRLVGRRKSKQFYKSDADFFILHSLGLFLYMHISNWRINTNILEMTASWWVVFQDWLLPISGFHLTLEHECASRNYRAKRYLTLRLKESAFKHTVYCTKCLVVPGILGVVSPPNQRIILMLSISDFSLSSQTG